MTVKREGGGRHKWINHHLIFHDADTVNVKILWINIAWLFTMSFIPFATAWVGLLPRRRIHSGGSSILPVDISPRSGAIKGDNR
ncbi:MAG: DUF1211 domain-containing protein [Lachnospiraceae bacterium]|nr:DUF1211 domain-containing protein [Lachnospiraceae bacterium]